LAMLADDLKITFLIQPDKYSCISAVRESPCKAIALVYNFSCGSRPGLQSVTAPEISVTNNSRWLFTVCGSGRVMRHDVCTASKAILSFPSGASETAPTEL
jgi:hypothetical protein